MIKECFQQKSGEEGVATWEVMECPPGNHMTRESAKEPRGVVELVPWCDLPYRA